MEDCGCVTEEGVYTPCLPCALKNAGIMLQQAGLRMSESIDEQIAQALQEQLDMEGTIGGSD